MKFNFQGRVALPRGLDFGRHSSAALPLLAAMILLFVVGATAETTNGLSDAEIQGQQLAQKILDQCPADNFTNTGVLQIRNGNGIYTKLPIRFQTVVSTTNWLIAYETMSESFRVKCVVVHQYQQPNKYQFRESDLVGNEAAIPFANSDFSIADLGLEFFHWPQQKILKKEVRRSRGCTVLESTNPSPSTNGYARVVSWIDEESGGIVQAEAYDFKNKLLKEFAPKSFKKVNGQWELQEMEIRNVQTGSRTRLEFDLKK